MSRRPPWFTARRAIGIVAFASVSSAAIVWNHQHSARGFLGQLEQALPLSAALSADGIADWVALRAAQARTLAAVASSEVGTRSRDLSPMLPVVVREGALLDAQVIEDNERYAALRTSRVNDSLAAVAFAAPIARVGAPPASIILTAPLRESTFSHFNVAAPDDQTQRTALLDRDRGTVTLLTVSASGGNPQGAPLELRSLPRGISWEAIDAAAYTPLLQRGGDAVLRGIGRGLSGQAVVYGVVPVPGTPWWLVRERDVEELMRLIRPSLLVTDAIFGLLASLVIGVLMLRWRSAWLRQEAESTRLRATFVASVSHELRTPLTQIRMYAEMLRLGLLSAPDDGARALGVIEKEAERLTMLIERSLAFVRVGQPAPPATADAVAVDEAVTRAVSAIGAMAVERGITLRMDIDTGLVVRIARDDLQQILLNLLDNAIKYGPRGQCVDVYARRHDATVRIEVRDEGPGVVAGDRERIWTSFVRGRAASESSSSGVAPAGSGIGLSVVRELTARAHGRAYVDASEGRTSSGAVFVIELPVADDAPPSERAPVLFTP